MGRFSLVSDALLVAGEVVKCCGDALETGFGDICIIISRTLSYELVGYW